VNGWGVQSRYESGSFSLFVCFFHAPISTQLFYMLQRTEKSANYKKVSSFGINLPDCHVDNFEGEMVKKSQDPGKEARQRTPKELPTC